MTNELQLRRMNLFSRFSAHFSNIEIDRMPNRVRHSSARIQTGCRPNAAINVGRDADLIGEVGHTAADPRVHSPNAATAATHRNRKINLHKVHIKRRVSIHLCREMCACEYLQLSFSDLIPHLHACFFLSRLFPSARCAATAIAVSVHGIVLPTARMNHWMKQ